MRMLKALIAVALIAAALTMAVRTIRAGGESQVARPPIEDTTNSAIQSLGPTTSATTERLHDHEHQQSSNVSAQNHRVRSGQSAAAARPIAAQTRFLPAENQLVVDGQLSQDSAQSLLRSTRFDDFVRSMRDQMIANAAAMDVGNLYISAVRDHLRDISGVTMGEFACGVTLCVGSIETSDAGNADDAWSAWSNKFASDPNAPTYTFLDAPVVHQNGLTQHRIVFSTDPESNAITGSFKSE
ncbi:MAG TPA: hypothetical protein VF132_14440 [Rudaea sp.]